MDWNIVELVIVGCRRAASKNRFRQFDPQGGEIVWEVYRDISRAVRNNPDHYRSAEHIVRTAELQAGRELCKLLKARRPRLEAEGEE